MTASGNKSESAGAVTHTGQVGTGKPLLAESSGRVRRDAESIEAMYHDGI
jgi:hypothetical protein